MTGMIGAEETPTRRVLVALDDDESAARVAAFVNSFFAETDVEILALNVAPEPVPWFPDAAYGAVVPFAWPENLSLPTASDGPPGGGLQDQTPMQHGERVIAASGIENDQLMVQHGDPAQVIADVVEQYDIDLIVIGGAHRGWWSRVFRPSVTDDVVEHAQRPVLVVP
jgi:nucleotide-binding universal stress UspA family protein